MAKKKDESRDIEDRHQRMEEEGAGIRNMSGSTGDFSGMRDKVGDVREASGFLSQSFVIDGRGPVRGRGRPARGRGGQRRSSGRRGRRAGRRASTGTKKGVRVTSSRKRAKGVRKTQATRANRSTRNKRRKASRSGKKKGVPRRSGQAKGGGKESGRPRGKGKVPAVRSTKNVGPVRMRAKDNGGQGPGIKNAAPAKKNGPERKVPAKSKAPTGPVPKKARSGQGQAKDEGDWEKCPNCGKLKRKGQQCGYCNE